MKKIILMLGLITPLLVFSQKRNAAQQEILPLKDGNVFYEKIYDVDSTLQKQELYDRSMRWLAKTFVDSKEVIRIANKETGNIVGKGIFDVVTSGFWGGTTRIQVIIDITVKDKKYRVQFYQFQIKRLTEKSLTDEYYPIERSLKLYKDGDSMSPGQDKKLFAGINARIEELMLSLYSEMSTKQAANDF